MDEEINAQEVRVPLRVRMRGLLTGLSGPHLEEMQEHAEADEEQEEL